MDSSLDHASVQHAAADIDADLIALRRDIHRHPELAGAEERTAGLVAELLRAAGLDVSTGVGGHGVVAVLDGGAGPTIAYRADMDAVDVNGEAAHLCGHDLHTTIGVGIAQVLARLRERLGGRVVFLFQPAEENLAGARAMIDDGVLDRTTPDEIYALHCAPLPTGIFAVMPGFGQPGLDEFHARCTGPDAADLGARLVAGIAAMSTVATPASDEAFLRIVADLQVPDGPLTRFVLADAWLAADADHVDVHGWVRAWPDDRYPAIRDDIRRLAGSAEVDFPAPPFPAMVCAPEQSEALAAHLRDAPDVDGVAVMHAAFPFNGEDFALFLQRVPGAMGFLGVADDDAGIRGLPHSPDFDADERAIGVAVRSMATFLSRRLVALG
jgi:metal-dependent amidase/aminoacylase/carboxypeptidase family protein